MIRYSTNVDGLTTDMLHGFFEGWHNPPSPAVHLRLLRASAHVVLAIDDDAGRVVGFINAISDGVMSAYIPLLEVLPEYRGRGIGGALVRRMIAAVNHLYMIDVTCDRDVLPFYEKHGMQAADGAMIRNFDRQSCGGT